MATQYKVYGTDEPYSGLTVEIGGTEYSTRGWALEGDSQQLIAVSTTTTPVNNNPVTRTFVSRVTYYRQDGTPVPVGSNLHQHADGTIMLGHDPNNMGAIVTRQNPNQQNQLMGNVGVNPNQDQQDQLMGNVGNNPNQDLQDTIAY